MPRPKGSRDRDYDARRLALMALARQHLSAPGGRSASWRDLASACGVSVPTMNHYFINRGTLVASILEQAEQEGAPYLAMASRPSGPFDGSVRQLVTMLSLGFERGVLALQVIGLGEGFADKAVGGAYLGHHLEPVIAAIARRLQAHMEQGDMRSSNARLAAVGLLSPVLVAHLHQTALGGNAAFPMSMNEFIEHHVEAFVRGHAA